MKSAAHIKGHPLHPMLIVIPAGAFIITLIMDLVYILGAGDIWWEATVPVMIVGVVGGLLAALPGLIDLFKVAEPQGAMKHGIAHGIINLIVVAVFTFNFMIRLTTTTAAGEGIPWPFWLSVLGVALLGVSGGLGWHMVYKYKVGVDEGPGKAPHEVSRDATAEKRVETYDRPGDADLPEAGSTA